MPWIAYPCGPRANPTGDLWAVGSHPCLGGQEEKAAPRKVRLSCLPGNLAAPAQTIEPDAQWNCSSSVEPVSAVTEEAPPWMVVVTSSK